MRISCLLIGAVLLLSAGFLSPAEDSWDRGYDLMREAYRLREEGEEDVSREMMARALALFRSTAADRTSLAVRPEVDLEIEEGPRGVNLIENRTLFKIEFRAAPPPPRDDPPPPREDPADREAVLRLQQIIIQNLAQVIQDNAELKTALSRLESATDETSIIGDLVAEIRDETSGITELAQALSDIRDRTDDIYDEVDRMADDSEAVRAVEDLAIEISDLRDAADLLRDILSIVQDIKDDTDGIRDLESLIDDVKSEVESLRE